MPQPIQCPICSASFATISDLSIAHWENLAGIRLVKHLAIFHKLGPHGAWLVATDVLCLASAERERALHTLLSTESGNLTIASG